MKALKKLLVAIVGAWTLSSCSMYNEMVSKQEAVDASWAQVENVYQRRADLIPNLVATVKGYAEHEKSTLEAVIEARSNATSIKLDASDLTEEKMAQFQRAQEQLSGALSRLMAISEAYPDLKASEQFSNLQAQLEGSENRIAVERKNFNEASQAYNTYIRKFPQNFLAGWFNFEAKPYFKADAGADKAPEVKF